MTLDFRLLNVFALDGDPFSGNPLAVIEDASGLDTAAMLAVARQFNLSETTFITACGEAAEGSVDATVRIFTPGYEMPFAGHPTLGTAYVVGERLGRSSVVLRVPAGDIPVSGNGPVWTLTANPATVTPGAVARADLAAVLGVGEDDLLDGGWWIDVGVDQFLVEVASVAAVRAATVDPASAHRHVRSPRGESMALVWAWTGPATVEARFFFSQDGAMLEDPATGSAAANLGSLLASRGFRGRVTVSQGAAVERPSRLHIEVTEAGRVHVGGLVREVGRGQLSL
ncbi:MAG TPA: PhzF family phenazine biosynthesis protein [Phycicoccus elongatus]|nr:PhzF family phenazine biosynthesis protein [Phycicoccus elongatus]